MAGKNPNFYSYQNFYGKKMLMKFHNLQFLKNKFSKINYKVVYENKMKTLLLNKYQSLPMKNFSKKHLINYSKQLILQKK